MDNTYVIASKYENFIRNVFNCDRNQHGAYLSNMQNVMFMEHGKTYAKHVGSFDKQFGAVQSYIEKALLHLMKKSKHENQKFFFGYLLIELEKSANISDLMVVVNKAFEELEKI